MTKRLLEPKECRHPDLGIDEKTGEYICFMCGLPTSEWIKIRKK